MVIFMEKVVPSEKSASVDVKSLRLLFVMAARSSMFPSRTSCVGAPK